MIIRLYFDRTYFWLLLISLNLTYIECDVEKQLNNYKSLANNCSNIMLYIRKINSCNNYHVIVKNTKKFVEISECNSDRELESNFVMKCQPNGKWMRIKTQTFDKINNRTNDCLVAGDKSSNRTRYYFCFKDEYCDNKKIVDKTQLKIIDSKETQIKTNFNSDSMNNCSSIENFSRKYELSDSFHFVYDIYMGNISIHVCGANNDYKLSFYLICNASGKWIKMDETVRHNRNLETCRVRDTKNKYFLCFEKSVLKKCDKKVHKIQVLIIILILLTLMICIFLITIGFFWNRFIRSESNLNQNFLYVNNHNEYNECINTDYYSVDSVYATINGNIDHNRYDDSMIESNACVYEKVEENPIYQTTNDKD